MQYAGISFAVCLGLLSFASEASAIPMQGQTPEAFSAYVRSYSQPEFFSSNSRAFAARLKLLDMAPKGALAQIATFAFENGESTRRLARHVCLASLRGVQVEFLIDSKYGSRPGVPDVFDKGDNKQVAEELLQYMANCGAHVYVHNGLESYVEILGSRLPNIFLEEKFNGKRLGLPFVLWRVAGILRRSEKIIERVLEREGIHAEIGGLFRHVLGAAYSFSKYIFLRQNGIVRADGATAAAIGDSFDRLVRDPVWKEIDADNLRRLLPIIELEFRRDPEFLKIISAVRRYNRLSHRKLFLVENGEDGCIFVGGRNLGDLYLSERSDSFYDGDVLLCGGQGGDDALESAKLSFADLKLDQADPFLGGPADNQISPILPKPDFEFRNLLVPEGLGYRGIVRGIDYQGSLIESERTLLWAYSWKDRTPVHGDHVIPGARNWRLDLTGWDPNLDQVRGALLTAIQKERQEIFLETPYAEFDGELREHLERALARGVKVNLITNSLLTSDGASKFIRILMMNWMEKMQTQYPSTFNVSYTSVDFAHMTHFKGAAFACQGDHRLFMAGSHNFHPRSGYADKEHMLVWEEPSSCDGSFAESSLVRFRSEFYAARPNSLAKYPNLMAELEESVRKGKGGRKESTVLALAFQSLLFEPGPEGGHKLRDAGRVRAFLDYLDSSGLHDLLGRVL